MALWESILVNREDKLMNVMQKIDESSLQFAVVVDNKVLIGTVTDGDIRRGFLNGKTLHTPICEIMNSNPIFAHVNDDKSKYIKLLKQHKLKHLPIVDDNKEVVNIFFADILSNIQEKSNKVILMLGGLGTRLRPLTNDLPKPMLKVGNKPIVETIVEGFKQYGYTNFIFSVNYKKDIIQNYFQSGEALGVSIEYVEESMRMGTAGALSLLENRPENSFFVMNGDLLTQVNFEQLMQFHMEQSAVATMCVREYEYQIPFGVIETEGASLTAIKEKPIQRNFVNAGIYVLSPEVFEFIPEDKFYDMPTLFEQLIQANKKTAVFPIHEYWLDIGQIDDFKRANDQFKELAANEA